MQIAPTTLIDSWEKLPNIDLSIFKNNDIGVYSFQSITYGLNDWNIFDINTKNLLLDHLKNMINYGILNDVKVFVFGCPRNRKILNIDDNNDETFIDFFQQLGDHIADHDLTICIEPNSKKYGCNYINTIKEAGELVKKINNKNIKMMVDIGNALMEKDNIDDMYLYKDIIYNIDIAQENMQDFVKIKPEHSKFIQTLHKIQYPNKMNLEMLIQNKEEELNVLYKSLHNFIYQGKI